MALYIRDESVAQLARDVQSASKSASLTDVVRRALENEMQRIKASQPIGKRLAKALALADAMGKTDEKFDQKAFFDAMWEA